MALDSLVPTVVFAAVFFYVLYGVVRDGILQADERRQKARGTMSSGGSGM